MRRLAYACWALLALAACSPASDTPPDGPAPPADAPAPTPGTPAATSPAPSSASPDFSKDINAVGTEPFWAIDIRKATMTLAGPDRPKAVYAHGGPSLQNDMAVFEGKSGGAVLKVTLAAEACSDGMSDLTYPYTARVEAAGEMLTGCAAPVDAWPKQPPEPAAGAPAAK